MKQAREIVIATDAGREGEAIAWYILDYAGWRGPCSVRSMSEIATGFTSNLLTRAADVALTERRPLVLMLLETPLPPGHLRSLLALSQLDRKNVVWGKRKSVRCKN